ncbi:hypothetical protein VKT23_010581 [Stygiomarasmius scandens]|uniref:Uncharacterized protein n=1 Tax=Marasmiellus scandens TaxID=2682957 RepID=A0ABR1JFD0_9AGAR
MSLISKALKRNVQEDSLVPDSFKDDYRGDENTPTIHLSNRYFTSRKLAPLEPALPFDKTIDPLGLLTRLGGTEYVYTEENRVEYAERKEMTNGSNKYRFNTISPARFRVGDIVEAQFTMMLVPVRRRGQQKYRVLPVMRALTLINGSFTEGMQPVSIEASKPKTLKRRIGNYDEIESEARSGVRRMCVGDANEG